MYPVPLIAQPYQGGSALPPSAGSEALSPVLPLQVWMVLPCRHRSHKKPTNQALLTWQHIIIVATLELYLASRYTRGVADGHATVEGPGDCSPFAYHLGRRRLVGPLRFRQRQVPGRPQAGGKYLHVPRPRTDPPGLQAHLGGLVRGGA